MNASLITDEMRDLVGKWQGEPHGGGEIHLEDIRKFARAVGQGALHSAYIASMVATAAPPTVS